MTSIPVRVLWIAMVAICAAVGEVQAVNVVSNGGFDAGFLGWTRVDQVGGDGTFFLQTGTTSPVNGDAVPSPPQGVTAAMTDAQGPGSHVLYQDVVISAVVPSAALSFDVFVGNRADAFFTSNTLDFLMSALNQQACVDELRAVCDRADRESRVGDVTLLDVQHACSGGKREVAVPDGELF